VQHGSSIHTVSLTGQVEEDVVLLPCSKLRQLDLNEVSNLSVHQESHHRVTHVCSTDM
jgi:hypothetical protein